MMGSDDVKLDIHAYFKDDKEAEAGEKSVRALADLAHKKLTESKKKMLEEAVEKSIDKSKPRRLDDLPQEIASLVALGAIKKVDEYLSKPPVERKGKDLILTVDMPSLAATVLDGAAATFGVFYTRISKPFVDPAR
jgi:hypothetical protein